MMRILTVSLLAVFMLASMASAQEVVIQPVSVSLEPNNDSYLQYGPRWIDGSGFTNELETIIETGDPVPAEWPRHITGYNASRTARIRSADEFETLTFDLGGSFELTGMVLWNSTESGNAERGFENTALSYSTDGGTTFTPGETLAWSNRIDEATGNLGNEPVDPTTFAPEVQVLASSVPGVTHVRMVVDNFSIAGANNIILASELRFTALPPPLVYYVAVTPTSWEVGSAWSDGNPPTNTANYFVTNNVALQTPSTTATFPGLSLNLVGSQSVELMVSGTNVITFPSLELDGDTLAAGVVDAGEAKVDGTLTVVSNSVLRGASDNSRDLRVLAQITGSSEVELSAPTKTIYIDNPANAFNGTWVVSDGTTEFISGSAVGSASIIVNNGALRIGSNWSGLGSGASLTVADSANVLVELGSNAWTVASLTVGSSNLVTDTIYDTAALNAIGSAVFTGSGTIQVGIPQAPPNSLVHHWKFDEGAGSVAADAAGTSDGAIAGATWTNDVVRGTYLSFDGSNDSVDPSLFLPQWSASNAETWAVWVKDAGGNGGDIILGNRTDGKTTAGGRLFAKMTIFTSSGRFVYNDGDPLSLEFNTATPGYSGDFPDGTWVHLAIVRDGADFTFYVDGNLVNSTPMTIPEGNMPAAAMPFFMGGEPGASATEHLNGGLDDVVVYNYALTAENVVDVMNGIYGEVDLSSAITDYSFNPSGTSSLSFTGGVSSAYVIKSTGNLSAGGFTTITPTAATVGSLAGDVITTDGTGTATAEFTETAPAQFYQVESAP